MRLSLGRALLYEPPLLFLDEPTNGLDINAVIWLENYLSTYDKTIIMVTHQLGFVNSLANYIWYIGNPESTGEKLYTIKGGYHNLLKFLEQTKKETLQKYEKIQKRVVEMRKKNATKNEVDEFIKKQNAPRPQKEYSVTIKFEDIENKFGTKNVIELRDVSFGYDTNNLLLSHIDFSINMGSRYVIVGENGMGKTTLFKLCTNQVVPTTGDVIKDDRVKVAHYHQLLVDHLPLDLTPIEYLQSLDGKLNEDICRARLGRIGIKKIDTLDIPKNKIGNLSGGQRVRVALCAIQLSSPSVILLDEITNDMDVTSIEAIIDGINEFNGAIILITHDTHLIESIKNYELFEIKNGLINKFNGDFDEYKSKVLQI
jgi:ATP-binding cassette subfamily F protein 1